MLLIFFSAVTILFLFIDIIITHLASFSHKRYLMVFHWNLSDFLQISRTLPGILADLSNAVVSLVSILPLIYNSTSPISKPLGTTPGKSTTIRTNFTHMWQCRSIFSVFFSFFPFHSVVRRNEKSTRFFFFC